MKDLEDLFKQQAEWQREQANLPWAEKLRLSVVMRNAVLALRQPRQHHGPSRDSDEKSEHPDR
jgi:hypothetical protein